MLKVKQATIDANEHFKNTIIEDEKAFGITEFSEREGLKSPTHLFEQRKRNEKAEILAKERARAEIRKIRRVRLEARLAAKALDKADIPEDKKV